MKDENALRAAFSYKSHGTGIGRKLGYVFLFVSFAVIVAASSSESSRIIGVDPALNHSAGFDLGPRGRARFRLPLRSRHGNVTAASLNSRPVGAVSM